MSEIISINPATGDELARFEGVEPQDVGKIVSQARIASEAWGEVSLKRRAEFLLAAKKHLIRCLERYARTITLDSGKPIAEAVMSEVLPVGDLLKNLARKGVKSLKDERVPIGFLLSSLRRSSKIRFAPLGVVAVISPWNYPFAISVGEIAAAILAGNCVVFKPSSMTPLVGKLIAEMFEEAGLPPNVFNLVLGNASAGESLVKADVDKVFFTGSVEVGRHVMKLCSEKNTPCVMELGGKDPMIVCNDANLGQASDAAVWGAFTNAGQTCASVERVYVEADVFDEFLKMVVKKARNLKVGPGLDHSVDVGPMISANQREKVLEQIVDVRKRNGIVHCGGEALKGPGFFMSPAVVSLVDQGFACVREETFGPIMPVMPFHDDDEAIRLANDSEYGLTASVWSSNIDRSRKIAKKLLAGTVMINDCVFTHAISTAPWGGIKASGFGRTHSKFGLWEMVNIQHVHTHRTKFKNFWWYPYSDDAVQTFYKIAKLYSGNIIEKICAIRPIMKRFLAINRGSGGK